MRTPAHSQDILRIFLRTFQHALGLTKTLLEYPNQRVPHLKGHYYVYLRKFLAKHKIQIEFVCANSPKLEQANDQFIINEACAKTKEGLSDPSISRTINYCKSYLQVKCLSDICIADGYYILPLVLQGERTMKQSASRLDIKKSYARLQVEIEDHVY